MKRITALAGCILAVFSLCIACKNTTVTVREKKTQYSIDFDLQEGEAPEDFKESVLVEHGKKLAEPAQKITRAGYEFQRWSLEEDGEAAYDFSQPVIEGFTLYAVWKPEGETYTVKFNPTEGKCITPIPPATPNADGKIKKPDTEPQRAGYTFKYWSKELGGTEYRFDVEKVTSSFTLYAVWNEAYTVKFNLNGVAGTAPADQTVEKGGKIQEPPAPAADGFSFKHWAIDTESGTPAYQFGTATVTESCTLYAIWEQTGTGSPELQYTISFNLNGGTGEAPDQTRKAGEKLTKPADPTRDGYTFMHWAKSKKNGTLAYNFDTETVNGSFTLFAIWKQNEQTYTIYFDLNGGTGNAPDKTCKAGEKLTKPADPTRDGYTFTHWAKSKKSGTPAYDFNTETVSGPFTLYAIWKKNSNNGGGGGSTGTGNLRIRFNLNGGTTSSGENSIPDQYINTGDTVTKPEDPVRTGFVFDYWQKGSNKKPFDFTKPQKVKNGFTLKAVWKEAPEYTVRFDLNGGSGSAPAAQKVKPGTFATKPAEIPAPPAGAMFQYWALDKDNPAEYVFATTKVEKDITLYAIWTYPAGTKHTVRFDLNGGTGTQPPDQQVEHGHYATKPSPDPTKRDAEFKGWTADRNNPVPYQFETTKVRGPLTFYAIWRSNSTTIMDIQGMHHNSPMKGQQVQEVTGIVTAITYNSKQPDGFYMQDPLGDGNDATSDGIYVKLAASADTSALAIGAEVSVSGTVEEHGPEADTIQNGRDKGKSEKLTVTQISNASFTITGTGKKLPNPVKLSEERLMLPIGTQALGKIEPDKEAIDYWESLEGMRVVVTKPKIVAPNVSNTYLTAPSDIDSKNWSYRNGLMYNDYIATPLVVIYPPACFPSTADSGMGSHPAVGDTYNADIIGVVGYRSLNFGSCYQVYPTEKLPSYSKAATPLIPEEPDFEFNKDNLNVVSYNLKNFSWAHAEDKKRAEQFADHFINKLKTPDVIALIEVQDDDSDAKGSTLVSSEKTINLLLEAIKKKSSILYKDVCIYPSNRADGGQGGSNIRCAYLYRTDRLDLVPDRDGTPTPSADSHEIEAVLDAGGSRLEFNPARIGTGNNGTGIFNGVRKSLVAQFKLKTGAMQGKDFFMICNHFSSKLGDDMAWGKIQPARRKTEERRTKQAGIVREFISNLRAKRSDAVVVSVGDYNDYWFSDTLKIMKGNDLKNAVEEMPLGERYTFTYDGKSQTLDHILVPKNVEIPVKNILNLNSEFADGISDHDPVYVQLHW